MGVRPGFTMNQIHINMTAFLLLTLVSCVFSFTPPRIIYGGWTPILPGNPFYFGSARSNQNDYYKPLSSQSSYGHQASSHHNTHSSSPYGKHGHDQEEYRSYRYGKGGSHLPNFGDLPSGEVPKISHILTKSVFSYYPPQSAYDKPRHPGKVEHKPVYLENTKKPFNGGGYMSSGRGLLPQDLKVLNHGAGIGHLSLNNVDYFPSTAVQGGNFKTDHDLASLLNYNNLHHPRSHASQYPDISGFNFDTHNHLHDSEIHSPRESSNTFKGTAFPHSESDVTQNIKDARLKHTLKYNPKSELKSLKDGSLGYYLDESDYKDKSFSKIPSVLPPSQLHPSKTGTFHDNKYVSSFNAPYQPSSVNKNLYTSTYLNKVNQMKNFLRSKPKYSTGSKSYYAPVLTPGSYSYDQYPKKSSGAYSESQTKLFSPKEYDKYDYKNVQVGKFYHDPSAQSSAQDTPTIVEEEVEIVHIPADAQHQHSINGDKEILYIKESTPSKHSSEYRNSKEEHTTIKSKHHPETYVEEPLEFHILEDGQSIDSEAAGSHQNAEEHESVFVGTRSLDSDKFLTVTDDSQELKSDNSLDKKQFFHAYYAPSDHSPPKGYLKMSPDEFHKLFKDAEIQYVQRDRADEITSGHIAVKRSS